MRTEKNIVILGASSFAREAAWLISDINEKESVSWNVIGFWEGKEISEKKIINNIPLIGIEEIKRYLPELYAVAAIGNPQFRQRAVKQAEELGCRFATLIHPSVHYDNNTTSIGEGSIICAGSILSVNVSIGSHVVVNWDCTIGHDSEIQDFVTLSPGCHLAGYSRIHRGSFIGSGAVTIEKRSIGENSIIGAGAVVTKDIPANSTAVGNPAKVRD